jgi:hypothetical protein
MDFEGDESRIAAGEGAAGLVYGGQKVMGFVPGFYPCRYFKAF